MYFCDFGEASELYFIIKTVHSEKNSVKNYFWDIDNGFQNYSLKILTWMYTAKIFKIEYIFSTNGCNLLDSMSEQWRTKWISKKYFWDIKNGSQKYFLPRYYLIDFLR